MIKGKFLIMSVVLGAMAFFVACESDDDSSTPASEIVIDASAYDSWTYFSFDADTVVSIDNFSTSTVWDIAFHRSDIRVNCGQSGPGLGGSYCYGAIDYNSVNEAPSDGYSLNTTINILESYTMPPVYVTVPGDTLVSKWLTIVTSNTAAPTYTFSDNIYAIRTASGKYAKIWLKDYFNEQGKGGYITMKYQYQPNGSREF